MRRSLSGLRGSHVGIGPRGFATSLLGLVPESAGICGTVVVWSQDWGLCLKAPIRYLKVRARFSAHSAQVREKADFATHLSRVCDVAPGTEIKPDAISPPPPAPTPTPPHPTPPHPTPLRVLTGAHDRIINEISKILGKAHGPIPACVDVGLRAERWECRFYEFRA